MKFSKLAISVLAICTIATSTVYAETAVQANTAASGDAPILAAIATIDANEILLGDVAKNKKVKSEVIDLANMMIDQHGANLTEILVMVNNAYALKGPDADKLSIEGQQALMKLGALNDTAFAKAYVDEMVKGHTAALGLIDSLMKTAKSDEVKKFLTSTRAAVVTHLEYSQKLRDKM